MKWPRPVLSSLNVAANKDVLEDVNAEKLISLVQGYVGVQENAPIKNIDLILSSKYHVAIQFSKYFSSLVASEAFPGHISVS